MQIYDFETLFRNMPEKIKDATHVIMPYGIETRMTLCVNNVEIYCDDTKLEYISVGHFGPTINIYFLEKNEVVAMYFMHVDDEMAVDGKNVNFFDHTSEESMRKIAKCVEDKLVETDKIKDHDTWLQERRNAALTAIREYKESKADDDDDEDIFKSVKSFEKFMEESVKAAVNDMFKLHNDKPPTT